MRRSVIVSVCVFLAFFVCFSTAVSADAVSGEVIYRQNFSDVSSLSAAGITEGERNTVSSAVSISNGALEIGDPEGDRTYALLPFHNCYSDYTVRFSFSFTEAVRSGGYVSLLLTSRGDSPDNITSVKLRADGDCEGFSSLSQRIIHAMKKGETVSVTVPVSGGVLDSMTVSADGVSETLEIDNIVNVVEGRIGFCVRNATVRISEIAVIDGVGYAEETGVYADTSTWTDQMPYVSPASYARGEISISALPMACSELIYAPATDDVSVTVFVIALTTLAASLLVFGRKRKV